MGSLQSLALTTATVLTVLSFSTVTHAQAHFRAGGANTETGNAARVSGSYNAETGARSGRVRSYDASTGTYNGTTGGYNPATGQGAVVNTTATQGSGVTSTVDTVNNGSYECSASQDDPASCTEVGDSNTETGRAARVSGGYNSETGARFGRVRTYDSSTGTYNGTTGGYNPATGQGAVVNTTATQGSGVTSTVDTVNNGSYECSASQDDPANCTEVTP